MGWEWSLVVIVSASSSNVARFAGCGPNALGVAGTPAAGGTAQRAVDGWHRSVIVNDLRASTPGALRAHSGRTPGALRAHSGRTPGALRAHSGRKFFPGHTTYQTHDTLRD